MRLPPEKEVELHQARDVTMIVRKLIILTFLGGSDEYSMDERS